MAETKQDSGSASKRPKPKMKVASISPDSPPKHPSYIEMIVRVLRSKPDQVDPHSRKGMGVHALQKEMLVTYNLPAENIRAHFRAGFRHALDAQVIRKVKGKVGMTGSVRFHNKFLHALLEFEQDEPKDAPVSRLLGKYVKKNDRKKETDSDSEDSEEEKEPKKKAAEKLSGKKRRSDNASEEPKKKKAKE